MVFQVWLFRELVEVVRDMDRHTIEETYPPEWGYRVVRIK